MAVGIRIECDAEAISAAVDVMTEQVKDVRHYTKMGYGYTFNKGGHRFFVRKTKAGLSLVQCCPAPKDKP